MAQSRVVKIVVQAVGDSDIKRITNSLVSMNKNLKQTSSILDSMRNIAAGLTGVSIFGFGARELMEMADSMSLTRSRINAFTNDIAKTTDIMKQLSQQATETKSSLADTTQIFSRVLTSTNKLNISTEAQIGLARILQQSFRLSGATGAEATAATIQFSQALSFGQLRGQELRSVLSQNAVLAEIFGKAIEGSGKDIYKFAEAGGFTTDFVLKVLAKNFFEVEDKASRLSETFGQTLTLAMNKVTEKVDELNRQFGLNSKFSEFVDFMLKNGESLVTILIAIGATALPRLAAGIASVGAALLANPLGVVLGTLALWFVDLSGGIQGAIVELRTFPRAIGLVLIDLTNILISSNPFAKFVSDITGFSDSLDNTFQRFKKFNDDIRNEGEKFKGLPFWKDNPLEALFDPLKNFGPTPLGKGTKRENPLENVKLPDKIKTLKEQLGDLNVSFNKGQTEVGKFNSELLRLTGLLLKDDIKEGTLSIVDFNKKLREVEIENLSREIEYGIISLEEFQLMSDSYSIDKLNFEFNTGKISAEKLNTELARLQGNLNLMDSGNYLLGFKAGLTKTLDDVGNVATGISDVTVNAFKSLEDSLFSMMKDQKFDFTSFVDSVLNDLTRMVIRLSVIAPIAQGFLAMMGLGASGGGGGGGGGVGQVAFASMGRAFDSSGTQFFAKGGIVNSPTAFSHSQGLGVMGEAGPEAILPLKRGSDGSLGVGAAGVVINVINNSNADVQTQETTNADGSRTIDLLIVGKVKEGIVNGMFDNSLKQSFGLQRRGI
jgi:tape measure domain-containing protein